MPKKSPSSKVIRKSAAGIPPATPDDLARLRAARSEAIDTSEIPERRDSFSRLARNAQGRLPKKSSIRDAVAREMGRLNLTPYRLWKEARAHCPTLSQPAVYEFLKGQRQLELPYAEALMAAVHLVIVRRAPRPKKDREVSRQAE